MQQPQESEGPPTALYAFPTLVSLPQSEREERQTAAPDLGRRAYATLIALAIGVGSVLRILPATWSSFPIGDGGMFYVMVQEIEAHHFALPIWTSYNSGHIPFDYPPLALYLVAALHSVLGVPWLDIFRLLPAVVTSFSVVAFLLLARTLLPTRTAAAAAAIAFAITFDAFDWEIKGGGVTRSVGLFFALLAVYQAVLLFQGKGRKHLVLAGLFLGLTGLSHLEWVYFAATSLAFLAVAFGNPRRHVPLAGLIGAIALLVAVPWLAIVLSRHGISPFVAAMVGSEGAMPWYARVEGLLLLNLSLSPFLSCTALLGLLGGCWMLMRRNWLLPVWLCVVYVLTSRAPTDKATIVLCLLAGVGVEALVQLLALHPDAASNRNRLGRWPLVAVCGLVLAQSLTNALAAEAWNETPLTGQQLAAIRWIGHHVPADRPVVVVSPLEWGDNAVTEWLPALTGRRAVSTVQGDEWKPRTFDVQLRAYSKLEACANASADCVAHWLAHQSKGPTYVYVPKDGSSCCDALTSSLAGDKRFLRVYARRGEDVFLYRGTGR